MNFINKQERNQRFSIRKFSIGAISVAIGMTVANINKPFLVHATEPVAKQSNSTSNNNKSNNIDNTTNSETIDLLKQELAKLKLEANKYGIKINTFDVGKIYNANSLEVDKVYPKYQADFQKQLDVLKTKIAFKIICIFLY